MGAVIAPRDPAGPGTAEGVWASARFDAALPTVGAEAIAPRDRRVVVIAPHPDDEVLGTGGLIATLAAGGRTPLIVAVTDGEASHPGSTRWPVDALARARRGESRAGLRRLGLASPRVESLRLPDGDVAAREGALRGRLCAVLRASDVVFVTWREDGHADHDAVGRATARACADVGASLWEVPVWAWHWGAPGDPRVPWARAVVLALDERARRRKAAAIRAHRTQLAGGAAAVLPSRVRAHFTRGFEVFFRAPPSTPDRSP